MSEPGYTSCEARYAKDKILVSAPCADGLKTRAARLLCALNCRYTNRERGFVCSPTKFARFERLFAEGWDANYFTRDLVPPIGAAS